jgi:branched-chain amino acid transport system permease protein
MSTSSLPHANAQARVCATWPLRLVAAALIICVLWSVQAVLNANINDYVVRILVLAGINVILAVSLNLINGIAGQFSLGHAGFMAIGAYVGGTISYYGAPKLNALLGVVLPDPLVLILAIVGGALAAALAGWLVGMPSLRLRGDYLAIVTLGFGEIIRVIVTTIKEVGGATGFNGMPPLMGATGKQGFLWIWAFAALCIVAVRNIAASRIGREMRALRDDEIAAEAAGINTTKIKVLAFVISSLWGGVAGVLFAHFNGSAQPDTFNFIKSVEIVVMVVLGGLGSITGAALAAVGLTILENVLRSVQGAFVVGVALTIFAAILSWPRHREAITHSAAKGIFCWLTWPLLALTGIVGAYLYGRGWLQGNISALRYVIYALILITLMILRPQGLLGRGEFGWHTMRRKRNDTLNDQPAGI